MRMVDTLFIIYYHIWYGIYGIFTQISLQHSGLWYGKGYSSDFSYDFLNFHWGESESNSLKSDLIN